MPRQFTRAVNLIRYCLGGRYYFYRMTEFLPHRLKHLAKFVWGLIEILANPMNTEKLLREFLRNRKMLLDRFS